MSFDLFQTKRSYDRKSLHQLHLAMKAGVPNILLYEFDRYQWERIRILRQSYIYFQVHQWMMGYLSVDFRFSFPIPNILWWYSKIFVWFQEKRDFLFEPNIFWCYINIFVWLDEKQEFVRNFFKFLR